MESDKNASKERKGYNFYAFFSDVAYRYPSNNVTEVTVL